MSKDKIYRVSFYNQNTTYEIYAKRVDNSFLYGFIEVDDIVFGSGESVVVDPAEERLKMELAGVKSINIPMHEVLRIDEVEKEGVAKAKDKSDKGGNVTQFPMPLYSPPKDS